MCLFPVMVKLTEEVKGIKDPCYIFDDSTAHTYAGNAYMGIGASRRRSPYAARSPDMNKMAEHAVANIKDWFFDRMVRRGANQLTARMAQQWLIEFSQQITAESVMRDARSLVDTMNVIRSPTHRVITTMDGRKVNGTAGDWPPSFLR